MFEKRRRKNEKWETIRKREIRNDVLGAIILAPVLYIFLVIGCAL